MVISSAFMNNVLSITMKAGEMLMNYFGEEPVYTVKDELDASKDFATLADYATQELILAELIKLKPEDIFVAEEDAQISEVLPSDFSAADDQLVWYIDPLDGTQNFSRGFENFGISIGAVSAKTGENVLGVLFAPALNKLYYAFNGKAYHSTKEGIIPLVTKTHSTTLILSTGVPYEDREQAIVYEVIPELMKHFGTARDMGSSALNLGYLAEGRLQGTLEVSIKPWDFMAGKIITEACGVYVKVRQNIRTGSFVVYGAVNEKDFTVLDTHMSYVAQKP